MTQDLIQRKEEKKGSVLVDTVISVFFGPFIAIISPYCVFSQRQQSLETWQVGVGGVLAPALNHCCG